VENFLDEEGWSTTPTGKKADEISGARCLVTCVSGPEREEAGDSGQAPYRTLVQRYPPCRRPTLGLYVRVGGGNAGSARGRIACDPVGAAPVTAGAQRGDPRLTGAARRRTRLARTCARPS